MLLNKAKHYKVIASVIPILYSAIRSGDCVEDILLFYRIHFSLIQVIYESAILIFMILSISSMVLKQRQTQRKRN